MAEKKQTWLKYFTVNLSSIQGRCTIGYLCIMIVSIVLLYSLDQFWRRQDAAERAMIEHSQPTIYQIIHLDNQIQRTQGNLIQYLFFRKDSLISTNRFMWNIEITNEKDKLRSKVIRLNKRLAGLLGKDTEIEILFTTLNKQAKELEQEQQRLAKIAKTTRNSKILQYQFETQLALMYREYALSSGRLIDLIKHKEDKLIDQRDSARGTFYQILIAAIILGFLACYLIGIRMLVPIFQWIHEISQRLRDLSQGSLISPIEVRKNEFKGISTYINRLNDNLQAIRNYALKIGQGDFSPQETIFAPESHLGISLNEMTASLRKVYDEEKKRNWTTQGLAEFGEKIRANSHHIEELCQTIVKGLVKHLDAVQGGFFLLIKHPEGAFFELKASYAYNRQKFIQKRVDVNEGLLGRAYNEREIVYLKGLPPGYMEIDSGLGNTEPNTLIVVPLINDENDFIGVIELASLNNFEDYHIEFLQKLANNVAATITMVFSGRRNQETLGVPISFTEPPVD